jgi:hypothetical protein
MFNFSSSIVYTSQNGLGENYSQENVSSNGVSQSNIISSIHPMSLDLYGLSVTPPPSTRIPSDLSSLSTPVDSISSSSNKHEIYPWMRKVHVTNSGNV